MTSTIISASARSWTPPHSREQSDYFSHKPLPAILEPNRKNSGIPTGFPKCIVSPTAWTGADFENGEGRERYSLVLDEAEVVEIEQACDKFIDLGIPLECVSQESFPLPILGNKLKACATELTSGVGFLHIRGIDPQRYSNQMNVVLYLGISSYIGGKRGRQDELGNMLRASFMRNNIPSPQENGFWELTHEIQSI